MRKISLIFMFVLLPGLLVYSASRYNNAGDGTILDNTTGLIWTKCSIVAAGTSPAVDSTSACTETPGTATWEDAIATCENLDFAGRTDWRLPNVTELFSIVDITQYDKKINCTFFPNARSYYWSSTSYNFNPTLAWFVNFEDGYVEGEKLQSDKSFNNYVRCVSGP